MPWEARLTQEKLFRTAIMRGFRLFSKLIGPPPSLQSLLLRINQASSGLALYHEQQAMSPEASSHIETLKSLEPYVLARVQEFENRQLLTVLQHFSSAGVASEELLAVVQRNVQKRVHSFEMNELANAAYFISRTKTPRPFLAVVEHLVLKDPLKLDAKSAALLAAAFGYAKVGSDELYRALGGVFMVHSKTLDGGEVAMFCVGFSLKSWKDVSFETALCEWTSLHYAETSVKVQTEILSAMIKYRPPPQLLDRLLAELKVQELTADQCEKILASVAVVHTPVASTPSLIAKCANLLEQAYALIETSDITTMELVHFIYTLSHYPDTQQHFQALLAATQRHSSIFTAEELISVLCALITTNKATPEVLSSLVDNAEPLLFSPEQLIRVMSAVATVKESATKTPVTYGESQDQEGSKGSTPQYSASLRVFVDKFSVLVQGRSVSPAEYTWGLMALAHIEYPGPWSALLEALKWVAVEGPEHYMQLYKAVERVPHSADYLAVLASRFESSN
jgi:hypothetical protein